MVGVFVRAVLGFLRRGAKAQHGVTNGRGGAVAIIQWNVLLATIERRILRVLARRGVVDGGEHGPDRWSEEAPVLAGIADASVQGRVAFGPRAGGDVRRRGGPPEWLPLSSSARGPCHAHRNGFDVHAGVVVAGRDRARLERVCRHALRPPVAHDRIRLTAQGQVLLELRHRWADGTSHLLFDPLELLERLAALTPRPRINLLLYYGVLGARSAWRSRLCAPEPAPSGPTGAGPVLHSEAVVAAPPSPRALSNLLWAQLMRRSFDVLACPRCTGRLRLFALLDEARAIRRGDLLTGAGRRRGETAFIRPIVPRTGVQPDASSGTNRMSTTRSRKIVPIDGTHR